MHLNTLTNYAPVDAITHRLIEACRISDDMRILLEGYGRVQNFNYDTYKVDPRPKVLLLGRWKHPSTKNKLACGINLNYLKDYEIVALQKALPEILKNRNLKMRYHAGKKLMDPKNTIGPNANAAQKMAAVKRGNVFVKYYRTYDENSIHAVTPDTLKFMVDKQAATAAHATTAKPTRAAGISTALDKSQDIKTARTAAARDKVDDVAAAKAAKDHEKTQKQAAQELGKMDHKPDDEQSVTDKAAKIKKKLDSVERKKQEKIDQQKEKDHDETAKDGVEFLHGVEKEHEVPPPDEDDEPIDAGIEIENRLVDLDVILEQLNISPPISWDNRQEYLKWHTFENFFKTHPSTGRPVVESATGSRFLALYDIIDNKLIIDMADSYAEMLYESGLDYDHTLCISYDGKSVDAFYEHINGPEKLSELMDGKLGHLISCIC
jgi:hypothetical protein